MAANDSPAAQSARLSLKLRDDMKQEACVQLADFSKALLDIIGKKFGWNETEYLKEIRNEEIEFQLKRITLHDILIGDKE